MKKKIVCIVLVAAVAVVAAGLFVPNAVNKIPKIFDCNSPKCQMQSTKLLKMHDCNFQNSKCS